MTTGLSPELIAAVGIQQLVVNPFASLRMTAAERLDAQKRIVTPCPRTSAPEGTVRIGFKIYQPSDK